MKFGKIKEMDASTKALNVLNTYLTQQHKMRSHILSRGSDECLLIEDGSQAIALTTCNVPHHKDPLLKIEDYEVSESKRGQGLGTQMMNTITYVSDHTKTVVGLWSEKHNISFYEKFGFKLVTKKRDYWLEYTPKDI